MRIDNAGLLKLQPQVVAFARALADAGEHRHAAVLLRQVADQLLNDDGLAHARAAEQADLAAAQIGFEKIDHLDAGLEHLQFGRLLVERRRLAMNRVALRGIHRTHLVHRLADHVQHAAQRFLAHRHGHRLAQALGLHAAHQSVGRLQRDGAHAALANVLRHFADDVDGVRHLVTLRW